MAINDPIGDMLTRIRNGQKARLIYITSPASRNRMDVLEVLKREGYIKNYYIDESLDLKNKLKIELKYAQNGVSVISEINRISTPGRRFYISVAELAQKKHKNGLGVRIVSTSKGVMSDLDALANKVGGELICNIF